MRTLKVLILMLMACATAPANAQVGIGTTSPKNFLDIPASNAASLLNTNGILIPRISAFLSTNPVFKPEGNCYRIIEE